MTERDDFYRFVHKMTTSSWNHETGPEEIADLISTAVFNGFRPGGRKENFYDILLGLPKRCLIEAYAETLKKTRTDYGIVFFDLDDFKKINDNYGHMAGDEVLASVAQSVKDAIPVEAFLSRWGGDEFLIIVPWVDDKKLRNISENIRLAVLYNELNFYGKTLNVGVSIGTAVNKKGQGSFEKIWNEADKNMYQDKKAKRDRRIKRA